jgi:putative transposase
MERNPYPSDLTDEQWQLIESLIPKPKPGGRPRTVCMREVINAIFYLNRTGCAWRLLPHEFPPWGTVHYYYRRFRLEGAWVQIHDRLRERVRRKKGRKPAPSAAILDSQSVKSLKGGTVVTTRARR